MALLSYSYGYGQVIEIDAQNFPYYNVIEWKGMGAILMSKDPNKGTRQIALTLVGNQETSIWDQKFNPKDDEFYFISSENARYVYFLDDLELNKGKVYFSQLNSAGNIKTTNVALNIPIKKLGAYNIEDLEFINAVVTDKALVHHFRYHDKKGKRIVEIATFITHHNFRAYAVELGSIPMENFKDDDNGNWQYIGFSGETVIFAAREKVKKEKGWTIKEFSSKGVQSTSYYVPAPEGLLAVENIGFGTTGSHYRDEANATEKGLLTAINGNLYLVGGRKKDKSAEVVLFHLNEGEWEELNSMQLNYFIDKKTLDLGIYPMNEGVGYHLNHNGYDKVSMIYFEPKKKTSHNNFTEFTIYNPSSVFIRKEKEEFVVLLDDIVIRFDTNQLGIEGPVKFEITKQ